MNQDFLDLLHALSDANARFMIVGAYALAIHGYPRATGDIDVWVDATPENAKKVYAALSRFGAPLHDLQETDLSQPSLTFQIGLPPRRIDVLTDITGVSFADAWPKAISAMVGDIECAVIGIEDMITNKRATGREKDKLDASLLERLRDQS